LDDCPNVETKKPLTITMTVIKSSNATVGEAYVYGGSYFEINEDTDTNITLYSAPRFNAVTVADHETHNLISQNQGSHPRTLWAILRSKHHKNSI
jgi:hypothetical protein